MNETSEKPASLPASGTAPINDCYSSGERTAMLRTQEWRGRLLKPLLEIFTRVGVKPDHLTILSLLAGLGFCPLFFHSPGLACVLLLIHAVLDGIDGPLARFQNVASRRGSLTDTLADQIVVFATMLTLISAEIVGLVPGGIYIFVYTLVVAFAMVRNALEIPYSWLVRPRFLVYCWIPVELFLWPHTLPVLVIGFDLLLSWKLLTGFSKLSRRLSEPECSESTDRMN
ncbi:MAG TPA: CDP-alcohol phosphatidyltransferase family protein [Planctomycetaceae bacterium]|nr:CDP-alcohol phosphatidyltransferase family protein [Planctomycetaceae bacterium]